MRSSSLLLLLAVPGCLASHPTFHEFVAKHGKVYEPQEFAKRQAMYENKLQEITAHNEKSDRLYSKGVNQYSDWTEEEMKLQRGWRHDMHLAHQKAKAEAAGPEEFRFKSTALHKLKQKTKAKLPESVDWSNTLNPTVPSQAACGSCWAFAGVAAVEGALFQKTGEHLSLSVQQFVDCTSNPHMCGGSGGCGGATIDLMLENAAHSGIVAASSYPYTAGSGSAGACSAISDPKIAKISSFQPVEQNNLQALMEAVARQPVAVSVGAGDWHSYSSGIFTESNPTIDHAVTLVGYGVENGKPYWKIRNSWGNDWGEDGYIRLLRHTDRHCEMDYSPEVGVGCEGGPKAVEVCGTSGILYAASYPVDAELIEGGSFLEDREYEKTPEVPMFSY